MTDSIKRPRLSPRVLAVATTPFPAVAGSPVDKTDDEYYCRACLCADYADHIEATGSITCAECDSEDVIPLAQKRREDLAQRAAFFADADREADARASNLVVTP